MRLRWIKRSWNKVKTCSPSMLSRTSSNSTQIMSVQMWNWRLMTVEVPSSTRAQMPVAILIGRWCSSKRRNLHLWLHLRPVSLNCPKLVTTARTSAFSHRATLISSLRLGSEALQMLMSVWYHLSAISAKCPLSRSMRSPRKSSSGRLKSLWPRARISQWKTTTT